MNSMVVETNRRLIMHRIIHNNANSGLSSPVDVCKNQYVPWALVKYDNGSTRCGFQCGVTMNSKINDLDEAYAYYHRLPKVNETAPCWMLPIETETSDCVALAMQEPMMFPGVIRD